MRAPFAAWPPLAHEDRQSEQTTANGQAHQSLERPA